MIYHFTRGGQYAIRAMVYMATLPPGSSTRQSDVAEATEVPLPYLSKLLASLARAGLVTARRGPWGGVALARTPETISLEDIIKAVEGRDVFEGCLLGYDDCDRDNPCPVHKSWASIRDQMKLEIHDRTLAELAPYQRKQHPAPSRSSESRRPLASSRRG